MRDTHGSAPHAPVHNGKRRAEPGVSIARTAAGRRDRANDARYRMMRVTPRPRGSATASGVFPSTLITWMSPLKSCPFSV